MRVGVTGSSGFIGTTLVSALRDEVTTSCASCDPVHPTPSPRRSGGTRRGLVDDGDLRVVDTLDAVVNLAGAGIADRRWSAQRKEEIRRSRIDATTLLVDVIAGSSGAACLVSGSAIGVYGPRGDEVLDEASTVGEDFLARRLHGVGTRDGTARPARQVGGASAHRHRHVVARWRTEEAAAALPVRSRWRDGRRSPVDQPDLAARRGARHHVAPRHAPERTVQPRRPGGPHESRLHRGAGASAAATCTSSHPRGRVGPGPRTRAVADAVLASQRVVPTALLECGFIFESPSIETMLASALT